MIRLTKKNTFIKHCKFRAWHCCSFTQTLARLARVHFLCAPKENEPKERAPGDSLFPALLGFGSTLTRQRIPALASEARLPCRAPSGVEPKPAMLGLVSREGKQPEHQAMML
jgi:hypothetical protein